MTTFSLDDRIVEFRTRLSATARRNWQPGQVANAALIKAFGHGWTPAQIAAACNKQPTAGNWRLIQVRIDWHADHPPGTKEDQPKVKPHDCDEHEDRHVCPWLNELDANSQAIRCGCPRQTAERP